jgi:hypothetical protein
LTATGWDEGEEGEPWASHTLSGVGTSRPIASRLAHRVRGLAVSNLTASGEAVWGQIGGGLVWVAGRAAGAKDYLGSLSSGTTVAEAVARSLCGERAG